MFVWECGSSSSLGLGKLFNKWWLFEMNKNNCTLNQKRNVAVAMATFRSEIFVISFKTLLGIQMLFVEAVYGLDTHLCARVYIIDCA